MQLVVTERHLGEGTFPTFSPGTKVTDVVPCDHYYNWVSGNIDGYATYFPKDYIDRNLLIKTYNPTELALPENSIVELQEVVYGWAVVKDENGTTGWMPFEKLKTLVLD